MPVWRQFEVWYVFKKYKRNSILRTVESTLKPNQTKTAQEHNTKSLPAAKPPTTTRKFLSLAHSFAPSLLIKSVSRTTVLSDHTPRVGKCWLYSSVLGKSEIISFEVGRIKNKSDQSHPPPEQAVPTTLKPVGYLSETQEERHSAGSSSTPAHGKAGI